MSTQINTEKLDQLINFLHNDIIHLDEDDQIMYDVTVPIEFLFDTRDFLEDLKISLYTTEQKRLGLPWVADGAPDELIDMIFSLEQHRVRFDLINKQ